MATILLFGASGPVGRFLLPLLTARHHVVPVSRTPASVDTAWLCADINDERVAWPAADSVISLGPLDAFAAWLERCGDAAPRRILALSSMSAIAKRDSIDAAERALAERLRDAEARVLACAAGLGGAATLLRPTLIYGAGTDRSLAPIARFARRYRILPLPIGARGLRQRRSDLQALFERQRHRRALGDVCEARALRVIELALEGQRAGNRPLLAVPFERDLDMHRAPRPLLALRIHAQRDRRTGAERRAQQVIGSRTCILTAELGTLVGAELMAPGGDRNRIVRRAGARSCVCHARSPQRRMPL